MLPQRHPSPVRAYNRDFAKRRLVFAAATDDLIGSLNSQGFIWQERRLTCLGRCAQNKIDPPPLDEWREHNLAASMNSCGAL